MKGPPTAGAFKERPTKPTAFRKFYERGDFPIALEHDSKGNKIAWKVSRGPAGEPAAGTAGGAHAWQESEAAAASEGAPGRPQGARGRGHCLGTAWSGASPLF